MRPLLAALAVVLLTIVPARAQVPEPGDRVELVERSLHIPAHPAPGDNRVPFRFAGGATAEVLGVDAPTGWIEIQGEAVGGSQRTGWIVERYIAGHAVATPDADGPAASLELAWCPAKGSPEPRAGGRLRLATWNLGNLHAQDGMSVYTGSDPSVKRYAIDYQRIRCYVRMFDPDVLAVQEVDGAEALKRVVDTDVYDVVVSERPKPGYMGGKQNTGFAFKKGLDVTPQPDLEALDVSGGSLRRGSRIDLALGGITFRLLSVHLKSGCFHNGSSGPACSKLFDQVPVLESWIDGAAASPNPPIVLGDFNRRFNQPDDVVWTDLDDGEPANADLTAVTETMPISCRDNTYTEFIDHIVFGKRGIAYVDRSSFRHVTYRQADKKNWDRISDHCPVVVEMTVAQ